MHVVPVDSFIAPAGKEKSPKCAFQERRGGCSALRLTGAEYGAPAQITPRPELARQTRKSNALIYTGHAYRNLRQAQGPAVTARPAKVVIANLPTGKLFRTVLYVSPVSTAGFYHVAGALFLS